MNDEIGVSRRDAIALAGVGMAGLALAGCTEEGGRSGPQLSAQEVSNRVAEFIAARGLDNHGDNPNAPPVNQPTPVPFAPRYMAVIHIKSDGPWSISANHAHFSFTAQNTAADPNLRTKHARDILLNKLTKSHGRFRDERSDARFRVYERSTPPPQGDRFADEVDFTRFQFGYQHDIYVFYEHLQGEIGFDDANSQYLTFSKFFKDGSAANRNHAFFNAQRITDSSILGGLNGKGSLIRLENHVTYKDPNDPREEQPTPGAQYQAIGMGSASLQRYKMNLIYITRSGLVMMIDPDTGNGVGYDPFIGV